MTFRAVFRYELSYRLRSPATWIYWAVIWLGTLVIVHISSTENNRVVNAPLNHAQIAAMLDFFLLVVTAGIFGDAATRDADVGLQPLFGTAPIGKRDYLGGRFAASFVVNAALLAGLPLMVALSMTFPWLSHFNWAPFQVMSFVQPYVLLTLPNLFIGAAVIFTIAALTKNALAMYVAGLGLAILYIVVVNQGLGHDTIENLIDPFALAALQRVTSYWTPSERLERLIGFPGIIVANRILWVSLAAGLLAVLHARFSFTHPGLRGRHLAIRAPGAEGEAPVRHAIGGVPRARRHFGWRTRLAQLLEVTRHSLSDVVRNRAFLVVIAGMLLLVFTFGWQVGAIVFDTSTWPVTHLIAGSALKIPMTVVFTVLISLVAGELVWKERHVGLGEIAAAEPVPDWIPFVGRLVALVVVLAALQVVLMAAGLTIQTLQGYYRFELGLYVKILFGLNLLDYLVWAALAMAVHIVVNHKNVGHAIMIAVWLFTLTAGDLFRVRHNLLIYNGSPNWVYSDLNGFGPFLGPFLWFKAYWGSWALLLAVIATAFWVRSSEGGLRARLHLARLRLAGAPGRAAALAVSLIVGTGGFVFYNTNVLNEYLSPDEARARRIAYERRYKRYEGAPQPAIVRNALRVEIHPERSVVDMRGAFRLVNATNRPIATLLVSVSSEVESRSLELDRPATITTDDPVLRQRVYTLQHPLAPGDSLTLRYHTAFERRGFPEGGIPTEVVANGAYFDAGWLPALGYRRSRELTDTSWRRKAGLPPRPELPGPSDTTPAAVAALADRGTDVVHTDVVIGTAPDQIAITPGTLVREWSEGGRRYFRYVTEQPIPFSTPFFSARYAVREDLWTQAEGRGVALKVFYHPTHTFNLDRIITSMKASLEYNSAHVAPYPFHELRVVEFPRYASFARAHPHTIAFGEGSAFITRIEEGDVDRPFFVVAHETAHQWWGNALRGARVKGAALVSETLAQYSAMMVMEKTYGVEMARRFYDFEMERYFRGRAESSGREVPLTETTDQNHLYYHKGAVAMYTLRQMIGEAALNRALRNFYVSFAGEQPRYATSLDLVSAIRAHTPDSLQYLLTDLFETITLWQIRTDSAVRERVGGEWRVTLTVTATKMRADSVGRETDVPMNDLVDVGVFAEVNGARSPGEPLYLAKHWIRSGRQSITVRVPAVAGRDPWRAGVDPYQMLVVRDRVRPVIQVSGATPIP